MSCGFPGKDDTFKFLTWQNTYTEYGWC